jgi:hypothetical protein
MAPTGAPNPTVCSSACSNRLLIASTGTQRARSGGRRILTLMPGGESGPVVVGWDHSMFPVWPDDLDLPEQPARALQDWPDEGTQYWQLATKRRLGASPRLPCEVLEGR